jgi:hypothetical protein
LTYEPQHILWMSIADSYHTTLVWHYETIQKFGTCNSMYISGVKSLFTLFKDRVKHSEKKCWEKVLGSWYVKEH